ncbi:hypothetical protein GUJ93_ZPchr0008g13447 [Zizania palustris]|uniref:Uncharacterized protein n=1 Tax=Zizania palustris TaxID=103762 RepID=A0A8J5R3Z4_ZIZPA|nr:hypothetical protein GUJ93_ZPchr0008g13447 [Zizania palustris]
MTFSLSAISDLAETSCGRRPAPLPPTHRAALLPPTPAPSSADLHQAAAPASCCFRRILAGARTQKIRGSALPPSPTLGMLLAADQTN